ncbi:MAG: hypothetical protein J0L97_07085 [Alphaproteobacteria bacterium]|nr:hypothetical protein [Alphaproteobacteria bacterium]
MTRRRLFTSLAALLALSMLCTALVAWGTRGWSPDRGHYGSPDMDAWLRLTIVTQLYETGDWFNHKIDRYGVPDALETPWTRPLDMLLLAGALPLSAFMPFKEALFLWATWLNPVLLSLSLLPLAAIARRLNLSALSILGCALLFILSPFTQDSFAPGRADHHGLLACCFLFWLRFLCDAGVRKYDLLAGMALALGLWISPEFLVAGVAGLFWLGARWLKRGDRNLMQALARICASATACAALFLTLEYGARGWGVLAYDTISPVHVAVLAAGLAWGRGMLRLPKPSIRARLLAALTAVPLGGALLAIFPGLLHGPASAADALAWWHTRTYTPEAAPMRQLGDAPFVMFVTSCALAAIGWLAAMRDSAYRTGWLLIGLMAALFAALALSMLRWHAYAVPVLALCIAGGLEACRRHVPGGWAVRQPTAFALLVLCLMAGVAAAHVFAPGAPARPEAVRQAACRTQGLLAIRRNDFPPGNHVILTLPFMLSTQVPFWTPHASALTWDYHRRADGLIDLSTVTYAQTAEEAREVLRRHRVTLLMVCDALFVPYADPQQKGQKPPRPFLDKLFASDIPSWMTLLPRTQAQAQAGYYLFEIKEP